MSREPSENEACVQFTNLMNIYFTVFRVKAKSCELESETLRDAEGFNIIQLDYVNMKGVPDEDERDRLCSQREKRLTHGQKRDLRKLEKLALQYETIDNVYPEDVLDGVDPDNEQIPAIIEQQYREILHEERPSRIERVSRLFSAIVPDKISVTFKFG